MRVPERRGVSPIIATLLLIAIAVSAGIIVYIFTNSIAGNLTQQGGQQVADQISMDAYTFPMSGSNACGTFTGPCVTMILRDVGSSTVTVTSIYFDGNLCQTNGNLCNNAPIYTTGGTGECASGQVCTSGQYMPVSLGSAFSVTSGTSHLIRVVTSDGGTFTFSVIAGRSG